MNYKVSLKVILFSLAFMFFCTAFLTGCGEQSKKKNGKTYDEKGRVVIRVSIPEGSISTQAEELLRTFAKENPDITFKNEPIVGDYTTKLITQAASGAAPDLIWTSEINAHLLASKGLLAPLEEYYKANNFDVSDVYDVMLKAGQYDGVQYMIPRDYDHIVTYYNKKIFKEKGIPEPRIGWTWEEFLSAAYKIPEKKNSVYTMRACEANLQWGATAPIIFVGLGGTITDKFPNGTSANFNTKGSIEALKTIKKLCDDGIFVNDYYNDIGGMGTGKVAMAFNTRTVATDLVNTLGVENIGVTTFPILPEEHHVGSGTSGYAIMNNSSCKEEAARFLFYVISPEGQEIFMKTGDCVPVLKSLANSKVWQDSIPGMPWEPFIDHPEYDILQPSICLEDDTAGLNYDSGWKNAFSAILANIMNAEDAAAFGQSELEAIFE